MIATQIVETHPRCRNCENMALPCRYGIRLQWVEDSVAKGICHGREGVWSGKRRKTCENASSPISPSTPTLTSNVHNMPMAKLSNHLLKKYFFLNTSEVDVEAYYEAPLTASRKPPRSNKSSCSPQELTVLPTAHSLSKYSDTESPLLLRKVRHEARHNGIATSLHVSFSPKYFAYPLNEADGYIVQYYEQIICSTIVLVDDKTYNPARFVLMPMASFSESVLSAILAISATKLSHKNPAFRHRALIYRQKVISILFSLLKNMDVYSIKYIEALICSMVLCWCDVRDT